MHRMKRGWRFWYSTSVFIPCSCSALILHVTPVALYTGCYRKSSGLVDHNTIQDKEGKRVRHE